MGTNISFMQKEGGGVHNPQNKGGGGWMGGYTSIHTKRPQDCM